MKEEGRRRRSPRFWCNFIIVSSFLLLTSYFSSAVVTGGVNAFDNIKRLGFTNGFRASMGLGLDVHFAPRTDGKPGSGAVNDPYAAATFEATAKALPPNSHMTLKAGTYEVTPGNITGTTLKSGWTIEGEGEETVIKLVDNLAGVHFNVFPLTSPPNTSTDGVTLRNFVLDGNWPVIGSSADDGTGGAGSTLEGVTANGYYTIKSASSKFDKSYIGRTISGAGIPSNRRVLRIPTTAIAAASDGATLPQSTINVGSAVDFFVPGTFFVSNNVGFQTITCTGKTLTSLTGCSGGTGLMSTGALVSTVTQLVMNGNATADASGVTISFGGQKQVAVGGIYIYGSNNTVENVHTKNLYGSFPHFNESFAIVLASPPGGPPGKNNHIRNVLCDNFYGDSWAGTAIVGISNRLPARDSSIENYTITGNEWPFLAGGAHAGGGGWVENCTFSGGKLRYAGVAVYVDTGSQKNVLFKDLQSYGMTGGIWLIADSNPDYTFTDVTFYNCQFDIMNMQLLSGDACNAVRINSSATTNLKIEHCRFMQRSGGMGTLSGHGILLVNSTNAKFFYNQFDTDGVYDAHYQYKGLNNTGTQLFYNRDKNGGLLTVQDGFADNVSFGATDINVTGQMTAGNINTPGTILGNGSLLTNLQAQNIQTMARQVFDADYVILTDDYEIAVTTLTHPITIALPSASQNAGRYKYIKDRSLAANASTHLISITPNVEGVTQVIDEPGGRIAFESDGTTWWVH